MAAILSHSQPQLSEFWQPHQFRQQGTATSTMYGASKLRLLPHFKRQR
jgi:hypothetical protein